LASGATRRRAKIPCHDGQQLTTDLQKINRLIAFRIGTLSSLVVHGREKACFLNLSTISLVHGNARPEMPVQHYLFKLHCNFQKNIAPVPPEEPAVLYHYKAPFLSFRDRKTQKYFHL